MDLRETAGPGALPAILFVSKRHSLRSVLAHGCMEHVGRGRFRVQSCGVPGELAGETNPGALAALKVAGMPAPARGPQCWTAFVKPASARTDIVIALDRFAFTKLPAWPRQPETALWNYPDLVALDPVPPVVEVTRAAW